MRVNRISDYSFFSNTKTETAQNRKKNEKEPNLNPRVRFETRKNLIVLRNVIKLSILSVSHLELDSRLFP